MESWRERYLGTEAIPDTLTEAEIEFFFRLDHSGCRLVARRRRPMTRLGLVLHIGILRMSGRHLPALERVPSSVLAYAAAQVGVVAPQLATLRAIYRRRPTLFEHQRLAESATGFSTAGEGQLRMLTAYLRRKAETELVRERLVLTARGWLYDRSFLIPGDRSLETMAARAQDHVLGELKTAIEAGVGARSRQDGQLGSAAAVLARARACSTGCGRRQRGSELERCATCSSGSMSFAALAPSVSSCPKCRSNGCANTRCASPVAKRRRCRGSASRGERSRSAAGCGSSCSRRRTRS